MASKARTADARARRAAAPRQPARGRGRMRYDALVDATETLLRTMNPDELGLYRIAEEAGIPPASAYHFFPTKEAAFTALAMRLVEELVVARSKPVPARTVQSWQALLRCDIERTRDFFNEHPAGLKIFYGGFGGVDTRHIDQPLSLQLASAAYERLNSLFHMPAMRDPTSRFETRIAILDALWSLSVRQHGTITDEYFEESIIACLAYSLTFLPERLEPRERLLEAIEADAQLVIAYDGSGALDEPTDPPALAAE